MALEVPAQLLQQLDRRARHLDQSRVEAGGQGGRWGPDERPAPRHSPAPGVAGGGPHHDGATRPVIARVVAHTLDDGRRPRVAYGKPLACGAGDVDVAAGRTVQASVAGEYGVTGVVVGRSDHDAAAGHGLADIVVGLAHQLELEAVSEER